MYTCTTGDTCLERVGQLDSSNGNLQPVLVILGIPADSETAARPSRLSDMSGSTSSGAYGLALVQDICTRICESSLSHLVVPVAMIYNVDGEPTSSNSTNNHRTTPPSSAGFAALGAKSSSPRGMLGKHIATHTQRTKKCLDTGAIDVLLSPLQRDRLLGLTVQAYRACKDASMERAKSYEQRRLRKRSWLGDNGDKKYAYLREYMYVRSLDLCL